MRDKKRLSKEENKIEVLITRLVDWQTELLDYHRRGRKKKKKSHVVVTKLIHILRLGYCESKKNRAMTQAMYYVSQR